MAEPIIISASRREDIPAFRSKWFIDKLNAGGVNLFNPVSGSVYNVSF